MSLQIPARWERFRHRQGVPGSGPGDGANGLFDVSGPFRRLKVMTSNGAGWEHASVSRPGTRDCASWEEMNWVRNELWEPEDCVMQLHPPRSVYIDGTYGGNFPNVLHLWRPLHREIPLPARFMVGNYPGSEEHLKRWHALVDADPTWLDREPPADLFR